MPSPDDRPALNGQRSSGGAAAAVSLREVSLTYGGNRRLGGVFGGTDTVDALLGIDADIAGGEFVTIVGPSGCGKSTLLRLVAGFARPTGGEVAVAGEPVTGPGPDRGVVFQQPRLFPWLNLRRNVEFGLRMTGAPAARRRSRTAELLDLVGLSESAARLPHELSGGMQQRAAIARALAPGPRILLMDEPFAALDALTRERLQEELRRIWRRTGTTILFVTHSVDEAVVLGTRIIALSRRPGRIVLDETSAPSAEEDPHAHPGFPALREKIAATVRAAAA
ncbi:ABC transporter ATP-binding protein [Actinomadura sp. 9N215]|uniref:ABC transporter ATP-binding protein n=1 Tax=Actinomadura sp. 9N215 TaxID=3375150 RepID=UPI0037B6A0F7